jgi:hypothetical protein
LDLNPFKIHEFRVVSRKIVMAKNLGFLIGYLVEITTIHLISHWKCSCQEDFEVAIAAGPVPNSEQNLAPAVPAGGGSG